MKKLIATCLLGLSTTVSLWAAPSILDIKHSISDENVVAPESFETKAIELEENFYLKNFSAAPSRSAEPRLGTPEEYEKKLSRLPTEIEMPYNSIVGNFIDMYIGKRSKLVSDMLALHSYYGNTFVEELEKEGLPLELQYLPVIESAINPNAVSRAGATGLWQFMPGTAKGLGMEVNSLVDQRRDPRMSSKYAAKYLKQLYNIYGDWSLAIAAYNCGPGNVNKAIRRAGGGGDEKRDFWEIYSYLPSETRGYIPAFIAANYVMNYYKDHGISPRVVKQPLVTDTVSVSNRVHFAQISGVLNIPIEEIRMLNPQYRKDVIPGNNHPYMLTLPSSQILSYVMSEQAILDFDKEIYAQRTYVEPSVPGSNDPVADAGGVQPAVEQTENAPENMEVAVAQVDMASPKRIKHIVGHGENMRDIAKRYNVSATDIKRWNNLRRAKVQEGDELIIETYERNVAQNTTPVARKQQPAAQTSDVPNPPAKQPTAQPQVPPRRNQSADVAAAAPVETQPVASQGKMKSTPAPEAASETTSQKSRRQQQAQANASSSKKKNTAQPQAKPKSVTVKKGDSLDKIARANGTTIDAIKKANNLKGDMIKEGQSLKMPANAKAQSGSGSKKSSKRRRR